MPLNIKDPEVHRMARTLAQRSGQTLTAVVRDALRERLGRDAGGTRNAAQIMERVRAITAPLVKTRDLDPRTADEIIGYGKDGAFD